MKVKKQIIIILMIIIAILMTMVMPVFADNAYSVDLEITADKTQIAPGETVTYEFKAKNISGNSGLASFGVSLDFDDSIFSYNVEQQPSQNWSLQANNTASYTFITACAFEESTSLADQVIAKVTFTAKSSAALGNYDILFELPQFSFESNDLVEVTNQSKTITIAKKDESTNPPTPGEPEPTPEPTPEPEPELPKLTNIKFSSSTLSLKKGESKALNDLLVLTPNTATKNITWSSNDVNVATVNSVGEIITLSSGIATITATDTVSGKSANILVNVKNSDTSDIIDDNEEKPISSQPPTNNQSEIDDTYSNSDIYSPKNTNSSSSNSSLPYAGESTSWQLILIGISAIITIISYIKYKKIKNI